MSTYLVQGKLGSGKGKFVMGKIYEALRDGRRVATNMDVFLDKLMGPQNKATLIRLPDKPRPADLEAIGHGNPGDPYNEDRAGVLVLDEAGSWLNARAYNDKDRQGFIDWMLHARKLGWNVYLQVQDIGMVDKQFRTGLAEVLVRCIRADKVKIPVVGTFLGKRGKLPRFHIANMSLADVPGFVVDREWYRNDWLQKGYDTLQRFREDYPHGPHSLLSAWHLVGRHEAPAARRSWLGGLFAPRQRPIPKPRGPLVERLAKLPPDRALYWTARLAREGLL